MDLVPLARLDREWQTLRTPRATHAFRQCAAPCIALAGFAAPADVVAFLRGSASNSEKDAVLAELVRCARDEPVAGRVVLEALLPGLKNLARRLLASGVDRDEVWSLLLAHVWARIVD